MDNSPVYVTFEFKGNLEEETKKATLGIKGLRDESAKTYKRLIADSNETFSAMSKNNQKLAISIQEDINSLRRLNDIQQSVNNAYMEGKLTTDQYVSAKARLAAQEVEIRNSITQGMSSLNLAVKNEQIAVGSIVQHEKSLNELVIAYKNLSEVQRESEAGKGMLRQISELDSKIKNASASIALAVKNEQIAVGSIVQHEKSLNELVIAYKNLSEVRRESEAGKGMLRQISELDSKIKNASASMNLAVKNEQLAVGSIIQHEKSLNELIVAYKNLSEVQRESEAGKGMLRQISELDSKIRSASTAMHAYNKTSTTGFNGLSFSVQQVARELPSLTMGANMFFLAISNNLPILADQIKIARLEYAALKSEGKAAVPVWKQVVGSILSWQTALVVGITLLTVYGKEIGGWIKSLFSSKEAIDKNKIALEKLAEARLDGAKSAQKEKLTLELLYKATQDDAKGKKEQLSAIGELRRLYPAYFKNLTDEEILAGKAAAAYDKLSVSIMESAKARASFSMIEKNYQRIAELEIKQEESRKKEAEALEKLKAENAKIDKEKSVSSIGIGNREGSAMVMSNALKWASLTKEVAKYGEEIKNAADEISALSEVNEKLAKNIKVQDLVDDPKQKNTKSPKASKEVDPVKTVEDELNKRRELYAYYYKYIAEQGKESADKAYADLISSGASYREYLLNEIAKFEKKQNRSAVDDNILGVLYIEKDKVEGRKTAADLLRDQIDKLKDISGSDLTKIKSELQDMFSLALSDNSESGVINKAIIMQSLEDLDKAAAQKFKDLLDTYQTGFQRLASLEKSYNDDVAFLRAQITDKSTEEEKKRIEDTITARAKAYGQAVLQEGDLFKKLFGDLERESTSSLEDMFSKLKTVDTSKVFSNPQDIKTFQDAVKKLESELRTRNPFKQLNKDFSKLLKDIKSGKDTKDALSGLTESFAGAKQYVGELGDSLGQVFGEETSYAIDQALQLGQAVFDVGSGAAKLANGDIIGGVKDIIKGIGSVFSMANKVKEMNRLAREENQKFYDAALKGEREHQMLIRERLRTEQQIGETSLAYNKRITEELAKQSAASSSEYNRLLREIQGEQYISGKGYKHGTLFRKAKTWNEYASLSGKTYEDIEKLYDKGQLDEKVASLFEQMKALKEEGADINQMIADQAESIRELYTGTTSEAIADSILSGFAEGKRSAADFADSFQEMLNNAVLNGIKMRALEEPLRQWYEQFAEASGNGLTADKIAELKAAYDKIINDAAQQLSDAEKITGIGLIGGDMARTATAKGIASMGQDSADELNGNFSALLIYADKASSGIGNIQNLMITGLSVLNRIEENTRFCRRLEGIESDMGRMRADIESIVLKGIYIKTK